MWIYNKYLNYLWKYLYTGSLLHMESEHCQNVTLIPTGTRHGPNVWDINFILGAGKIFFYKAYFTFYV